MSVGDGGWDLQRVQTIASQKPGEGLEETRAKPTRSALLLPRRRPAAVVVVEEEEEQEGGAWPGWLAGWLAGAGAWSGWRCFCCLLLVVRRGSGSGRIKTIGTGNTDRRACGVGVGEWSGCKSYRGYRKNMGEREKGSLKPGMQRAEAINVRQ